MTAKILLEMIGGVRAAIFAALCVALGATVAIQSWRLKTAKREIAASSLTILNFENAQKSNLSTIDDLREANTNWARKCGVDPAATAKASQETEQASGALPADDQRRNDHRSTVYANDQDAAAWGGTRVPDAIADRLRK